MWSVVKSLQTESNSNASLGILHLNDIRAKEKAFARAMLKESFPGDALSLEKNMEMSAQAELRLGNFKQFCTIMIHLGKWETAIAIAPAVSMAYWKRLCERYSTVLKHKQGSIEAAPYLLASGNADQLMTQLVQNDKNRNMFHALLLAASDAQDALPKLENEEEEEANREEEEREDVFVSDRIKEITVDFFF